MSAFAYLWGQFIDHDLDLTPSGATEPMNIAVPAGDPWFDPTNTGTQTIGFTRSGYVAGTGLTSPRQQPNTITAYLDGSMVYGSDAVRALALRTLVGGKLRTSPGDLLPFNTMGLANDTLGGAPDLYFVAGDVRANENIELTAMQTLFVREHNRLATQIGQQNPTWTDEQIYQQARRLVSGEIEAITYHEFLPALLGPNAIAPYQGYNPNVNAGVSTEFSTAAFRLGHSMLENDVEFLDNNGHDVRDELPLAEAFFNPAMVQETGIGPILKYLASSNSEEIDNKIVDGLRNFLFGPPGAGGFDLSALNIQRGRDHGLADYNSTRAAMGLPRVTSFDQITSDVELQQQLATTYGSVDDIDLWVGGLAEDHVAGGSLGPTFRRILVDEFTRVRDGDRFWYQADLTGPDLNFVNNTHLSDLIARNSEIDNLQPNAFMFDVRLTGRAFDDANRNGRFDSFEHGIAGQTVSLLDADGNTLASVKTGADGGYVFRGLDLGGYQIKIATPRGWRLTSAPQGSIEVTRGIVVRDLDFGESRAVIGQGTTGNRDTLFSSKADSTKRSDLTDLIT